MVQLNTAKEYQVTLHEITKQKPSRQAKQELIHQANHSVVARAPSNSTKATSPTTLDH